MANTILAGYYGFGNAGDELILLSLIRQLKRDAASSHLTVLSQNPQQTEHYFGIQALNRWKPWTWVPTFLQGERFILGGGGLLQECTGSWNHAYYLFLLVFAKIFGCYTEVRAIGVDPIQKAANRFWTRWVFNHWVDTLSVRDEESKKILRDCGVAQSIHVVPDPVMALQPDHRVSPEPRFACALAASTLRSTADFSTLLQGIHERYAMPIDLLVLFPAQDERMAYEIQSITPCVERVRVIRDPAELLGWIPGYSCVVGSRFHALVLASLAQVPFMGWGPQNKIESLCHRFHRPYLNTDLNWDPEKIYRSLESLLPTSHRYQSINKTDILQTQTD